MDVPILNAADLFNRIERCRRPWHEDYLAMYSSVFGGIVTDPVLMVLPMDDHLVHRADGVFDVFKCVNGRAYCMKPHLERLQRSAAPLGLAMPAEFARIEDIIRAAAKAGGESDILIRIIVSRGPGGFGTNPYECPASQLYVVVTRLKPPKPEKYENGVSIISAPVPVKPQIFANIKSCDYLGNVLVKKAAIEAGVDYAVNWDERGFLAEGSTENIFLVSPDRKLLIPSYDRVLKGVTLGRVAELARVLVKEGLLTGVEGADIDRDLAARCPEVMLSGTTMDILPVTVWDGRPIGDGRPGPAARRLISLIRADLTSNDEVLTTLLD
ncbi:MAG: aminotransferase class IV [Pseudomonadota bacterium]